MNEPNQAQPTNQQRLEKAMEAIQAARAALGPTRGDVAEHLDAARDALQGIGSLDVQAAPQQPSEPAAKPIIDPPDPGRQGIVDPPDPGKSSRTGDVPPNPGRSIGNR